MPIERRRRRRRTGAAVRLAASSDPRLPTGIYMVAMKHRARLSQAERAAFAEAITWASMGTSAQSTGLELVPAPEAEGAEAA